MDILSLISGIGGGGLTVLWFVLALSIIVAIHEYGHYIVGRWSGIGADVFSLGFGPVIWSRYDKRGTKWQIAAIPLGGYVKFKGDANAASGKDGEAMDEMSEEERRHTMHGAPLWARAATVLAGPVFNFILSIIIFTGVMMFNGQIGSKLIVGEIWDLPEAPYELQQGDVVTAIAGAEIPSFDDPAAFDEFAKAMPKEAVLSYSVERDGGTLEVSGPFLYPPMVQSLAPRSAAYNAGLEVGDVFTAIDGAPIVAFSQLKEAVEGGEGRTLSLTVDRAGTVDQFDLTPRRVDEPQADGGFVTHWRIGIGGGLAFDPATETLPAGEAFMAGVRQTGRIMEGSVSGLYHMITGAISSCNLSGPVGIAQTSSAMASQGAQSFIWFIAVLSTAIGLLNLFPIPMLDGGHLVFYAYEAVTGKPPADGVLRILMTAGLVLVLSMMVFGLTNDLFCP
ncbi:RIP metalloprotease RseP [Shimia sagamensis]|uniref:Zinc metalloprotease n=1 Tax=Shimia sagamensis TaxID=1566352 RepID=A0ABY1P262_9RHOB|nr:RIP metalloprotease RseP [Shimia sagamensis]SMP23764.1 regulator of sigma E protease [Shimia sagamensis]